MNPSFKRPQPSFDLSIDEIPNGISRVRVIAYVVGISGNSLIINDRSGQLTIALGNIESNQLSVGSLNRFVIELNKDNSQVIGKLISFNAITKEQFQQYKRLVKLERRIPK